MELRQSQTQQLTQQQLQNLELLQMSALELEQYVQQLALENPLVELADTAGPAAGPDDELVHRLRWLEENDRQNTFYHQVSEDELDPLAQAGSDGGLEETLYRFISRQLPPLRLPAEVNGAVLYLAACLDDDGYLRAVPEELAAGSGISLPVLERALEVLRSLEPAGVGAADLAQCLGLQLERIGQAGPAAAIVREHLESLARGHYKAIAGALGVSQTQVRQAARIIRELEPRPGALFQRPEQTLYIQPDVFIEPDETGRYVAACGGADRPPFHLNAYYRQLLAQTADPQVREYLAGKLQQAKNILQAVARRRDTLLRCAQAIADRQSGFFRDGPTALTPMRMADVAAQCGIHESTVSRAIRGKSIQCARGVFPMSYFFTRPADHSGANASGGTAARALLRQIIDGEDRAHPLSDEKLRARMAAEGCPVSRRTVAKYREQMCIPDAARRQ